MASEKILERKKKYVDELSEKFANSVAGVVVDYRGITVEQDTKLRKELREANIDYFVAKNTMLKFATSKVNLEDLHPVFEGTVAVGLSNDDHIITAKILTKYSEESKGAFKIKAGFIDGKFLGEKQVEDLGHLPSKEVLIAKTLCGLNAPISGFANVLSANIRGLVIALDQIAKKSA